MEEKLQDMDFQFEAPEELSFEAPEFDIDSLEELEVLPEFNQSFDSPDNNEIPSFDIPEESIDELALIVDIYTVEKLEKEYQVNL